MSDAKLIETIDMAERTLQRFCRLVDLGQRQGGGREFSRQIDAQFRQIRAQANMPEFEFLPTR